MKKATGKNKKLYSIILAVLCVLFLATIPGFLAEGKGSESVFAVILAAACGYCAYAFYKKGKQQRTQTVSAEQQPAPHITIQTVSTYAPDVSQQPKGFPAKRGYFIKYHYDDVEIAVRDRYAANGLQPGDSLMFKPEPDNQYDSGAVAIYHNSDKVGYMYKGRLQDMCRDFLERGDKVAGIVVSDDFGRTIYKIAFYVRQTVET